MSETKHTPGPWMVRHAYNVMAGRRSVATCGGYYSNVPGEDSHGENVANAHLVAAAPDLLAACQAILSNDGCNTANDDGVWICVFCRGEWEESGCNHSDGCPIIMAKAAIAAAKGE